MILQSQVVISQCWFQHLVFLRYENIPHDLLPTIGALYVNSAGTQVLHTYLGWHKGTRWINRCFIIKTILQHEEMCGSRMIGCTILKNGTYSTPPPISGTKTSRKLLILKLFPTPFKLMGSRNHRLMFAQFYMSFYHKNPKMNSWNPNSWRFCFRWFSFSGPFFRFHAVHVPCLQPAPPFAHLDDLSDMLWWPQRCPGGFQVPGLPVVFFNKNKHLQKQINYILDLPEKKVKYVCPFFWYRFFFVGWNFGTIFYTLGSRSRYVQKHGKAWTLSFPTFGLQVAFLPFAAPQHRTSGAKASENELPSGLVEKKILQSS